jgi:hypothetical protein
MKQLKSTNPVKTPNSPKGLGDYYGTGIKAKIGRVIEGEGMKPVSPQKMGNPPKALA